MPNSKKQSKKHSRKPSAARSAAARKAAKAAWKTMRSNGYQRAAAKGRKAVVTFLAKRAA